MWNLINNNLKIFIDPFVFFGLKNLNDRILLIDTLQNYFEQLDPNLCKVTFYYPEYIESELDLKRTFLPIDKVSYIKHHPKDVVDVFPIHHEVEKTELGKASKMLNEFFSIAIENKCVLYLSESSFDKKNKIDIKEKYGIEIVNIKELYKKIELFLQGFYNYFKFSNMAYGIYSPDIAHAMSDEFHNKTLIYFESEINKNQPNSDLKEKVRSFVHNRYIDILVAIDNINFFKLQQRIYDVEHNIIDNKKPHFHGYVRYHLNYYLFLLWGALDHLAWITNDLFNIGYDPKTREGQRNVGFNKNKKEFLKKIKDQDIDLYNFITQTNFQDWMFFFSQLRHQNAHREMFSASPLMITTEESSISDEEIDKIIYKDNPPVPKEIEHLMPPEFIENQKIIDRSNYRISKTKKGIEHFATIEKDGQQFIFNPVERIHIDIKNIRDLVQKIFEAYKKHINKKNERKN